MTARDKVMAVLPSMGETFTAREVADASGVVPARVHNLLKGKADSPAIRGVRSAGRAPRMSTSGKLRKTNLYTYDAPKGATTTEAPKPTRSDVLLGVVTEVLDVLADHDNDTRASLAASIAELVGGWVAEVRRG